MLTDVVLTTKPRFHEMRTRCVNVRLDGEDNKLRENLCKCY